MDELEYLFWSPGSWMEMVHPPMKNSLFWSPQKWLEMSPGIFKKHPFCCHRNVWKYTLVSFKKNIRWSNWTFAALLACSKATAICSTSRWERWPTVRAHNVTLIGHLWSKCQPWMYLWFAGSYLLTLYPGDWAGELHPSCHAAWDGLGEFI